MRVNKDFSQDLLDLIEEAKKNGKDYYIIPSRAMNRYRNKKRRTTRKPKGCE